MSSSPVSSSAVSMSTVWFVTVTGADYWSIVAQDTATQKTKRTNRDRPIRLADTSIKLSWDDE